MLWPSWDVVLSTHTWTHCLPSCTYDTNICFKVTVFFFFFFFLSLLAQRFSTEPFKWEVCFWFRLRFQLIEDLSCEDVKKCYRGSVSLFSSRFLPPSVDSEMKVPLPVSTLPLLWGEESTPGAPNIRGCVTCGWRDVEKPLFWLVNHFCDRWMQKP